MSTLGKKNVLCYGDDLTAGHMDGGSKFSPYSSELFKAGQGDVDTFGMSIWTTEEMVNNLDATNATDMDGKTGKGLRVLVTSKKYDWVLLWAGTNDLGTDITADVIFSNICKLVDVCVAAGVKNIGVLTVPACGLEWSSHFLQQERPRLNEAIMRLPSIEKYASGCDSIIVPIDVTGILPNGDQKLFEDEAIAALWDPDQLHLSETGSKKLGQFLVNEIYRNDGVFSTVCDF
jgi:lysophospholipase L1-like esterase